VSKDLTVVMLLVLVSFSLGLIKQHMGGEGLLF